MGDFKGHAIPGTFFVIYGLFWAVGCLRRYFGCRKSGTHYRSTATFPMDCCQGRIAALPMEGFLKILFSSAGFLGELLAHLPVPPMGIVQHATMYLMFLLSGCVDVAVHYGVTLPPGTDYISLLLALVVEGLLFAFHVHGRPDVDIHLHVLLVYVIAATVLVLVLEAKYQQSVILTMSRAYLLMLQGTWFWGVAVILYGHSKATAWDLDSGESIMLSTIYFSWHCAAVFVLLLLLAAAMSCCYRRQGGNLSNNIGLRVAQLQLGSSAGKDSKYGILAINDLEEDDDEDVEFDRSADLAVKQ